MQVEQPEFELLCLTFKILSLILKAIFIKLLYMELLSITIFHREWIDLSKVLNPLTS